MRPAIAIIPAAGHSTRMGRPKLLLTVGERTVIARLLAALTEGGIAKPLVVVRRSDEPLIREVERHGGRAVLPAADPPDMRASIAVGLNAAGPIDDDQPWLLVPADHPVLLANTVRSLLAAAEAAPGKIIVPTFRGRRGHPTVLRGAHAAEVDVIPADQGLNWLIRRDPDAVVEVEAGSETVLFDLDTPDDFARLQTLWREADDSRLP